MWAMTRLDLSPLFRSTIGFDRMMRALETAHQLDDSGTTYPPYNIEKTGEDAYRITIAVAGFTEDDLDIEVREGSLHVTGNRRNESEQAQYLYRGIAGRAFQRSFQLADYVEVRGASLENGLLHIDLVRELPEAMKPRHIEIGTGARKQPKVVEGTAKAA